MGVELELIKDMICFRLLSGVGSFLSLCCGVLDFEVLMQSALTSMPWEGSEGTDNPLNVVVPGCHPLTLCWDAWDSSPQLFAHCSGTTHVIDLVLYNPYLWVEAHLKKKNLIWMLRDPLKMWAWASSRCTHSLLSPTMSSDFVLLAPFQKSHLQIYSYMGILTFFIFLFCLYLLIPTLLLSPHG